MTTEHACGNGWVAGTVGVELLNPLQSVHSLGCGSGIRRSVQISGSGARRRAP